MQQNNEALVKQLSDSVEAMKEPRLLKLHEIEAVAGGPPVVNW